MDCDQREGCMGHKGAVPRADAEHYAVHMCCGAGGLRTDRVQTEGAMQHALFHKCSATLC